MCSKQSAVCVLAVFFKSSRVQSSVSLFTSVLDILASWIPNLLTSWLPYKLCNSLGFVRMWYEVSCIYIVSYMCLCFCVSDVFKCVLSNDPNESSEMLTYKCESACYFLNRCVLVLFPLQVFPSIISSTGVFQYYFLYRFS